MEESKRSFLKNISGFVRWNDWGPGKVPVLFSLLTYIGLSGRKFSIDFLIDFFLFVVFAVIHSALGYVVNDWGDREIDRLQGKANAFEKLTPGQGLGALSALFVVALLSGLPFVFRPLVLPLWAAWAFFAIAYSLRPLRFKERGVMGLTVSACAQWTLPVLLAFAAMGRFGGWDMIVFAAANSVNGATLEIAHQRWDRRRDLSTNTDTLGARMNRRKLDRLYTGALLMDKVSLGCVLAVISAGLSRAGITGAILGFSLFALYAVVFVASLIEMRTAYVRNELVDPYYSSTRSVGKVLHETLPNLLVPGTLALCLTIYYPLSGFLLAAFLYFRIVMGKADWRWPLRAVRASLQKQKETGTI